MIKKLIILALILSSNYALCQNPKRALKKIGDNPVYYIDSLNVAEQELLKYEPTEIASVTVYKGKEAIEILGEDGKDGAIYIETIKFSMLRYWKYFSSKSTDYTKIVPNIELDSTIQYILNDKVLTENYQGDLAIINDEIFKSIEIIDKNTLEKEYGVFDKKFGVVIQSDIPKNLYKAKKKF